MNAAFRSFVYAFALLFPLAAVAAGAANQGGPLTLTLAAPKRTLKAGQPLVLRVKVTNTSNQAVNTPITLGDPGLASDVYRIHVLDEQGQPASSWVPPPPPKGGIVIRAGTMPGRELEPGGTLVDEVNISHVYDLTRPGKYRISIAEPYYRGPGLPNGLVKSNTITVTVVR